MFKRLLVDGTFAIAAAGGQREQLKGKFSPIYAK